MKVPVNCPICHQPMKNDFALQKEWEILIKECHQLKHHLVYKIDLAKNINDKDQISSCKLIEKEEVYIWYPSSNKLVICNRNTGYLTDTIKLPYFEPNFSDYVSLLRKLKTYMVFS